ncbi:MAG: DNA primase [Lachnospiraceae bacterium]|nr:DNA primase [Lachnospiraceae bacterium]
MYYPEELIQEIAQKNDIVDVIGSYVHLTKKGANYFGLCPFHNEKSGSFSVRQDRQFYHCFGCGASGNVYRFLMEHERLTFTEAVEMLAEKAGITLPEKTGNAEEEKRSRDRKARLYEANREAATFYFKVLRSEQGKVGMDYFAGRKLSPETMQKFGLGYAPMYNDAIIKHLRAKGFTDDIIRDAGLAGFHEKYGLTDKFFNRVMFPIFDVNQKVIGFGGRVLGDAKPKYLNSPETDIFDKSRNLYGLQFAKNAKKNHFILCEGYMDVIALHQAGFTESVASLGTAFTPGQAMIIKRYTRNVLLSYDSDEAGVKAALRGIQILREAGLHGKVVDMRPYKDPDEFIKNLGAEEYQKRLDQAENGFFFEVRQAKGKYALDDPDEKTLFYKEIASLLYRFEEEIERENYLEAIAKEYSISADSLRKMVRTMAAEGKPVRMLSTEVKSGLKAPQSAEDAGKKSQRLLLNYLTAKPSLFEKIKAYVSVDDFTDDLYKRVAMKVFQTMEEGTFVEASLVNSFGDPEEQDLVANIFATELPAIETEEEKEKAFKDVLLSVKQHSFMAMQKEGGDLTKLLAARQNLERLQKIRISMN